jgi:hypothetical protein
MKRLHLLIISTICSVVLVLWSIIITYEKFTDGDTYFWITLLPGTVFLAFFIKNIKDIIDHRAAESS